MRKGEILYKILDAVEDTGIFTANSMLSILYAGYGASMGKLNYEFEKLEKKSDEYKYKRDQKRQVQIYLSKLKNDGLILRNTGGLFKLSPKGKNKLKELKKRRLTDKDNFNKEPGDKVIIISYDIPVQFNRERRILSGILFSLGFKMIHKSVWVGKVKLPKEFIAAMSQMNILHFVEIMEVTKKGSLKQIE